MNRNERWLSSIALLISVLPLILIALVQSFVQSPFLFVDIATKVVYELDVYQINFVGLFCVIPFLILFIARTLRNRGLIEHHFKVIVIATLVMSCVYISVICWIVVMTVKEMDFTLVFTKIDYVSMDSTWVCLIFSMLCNCLPDLKPNPVFGVKNRRTMADPEIWTRVNSAAASALTYIFLVDAVCAAYAHGVASIMFLLAGIFIYYIWVAAYSRYSYKKFVKEHPDMFVTE